MAGYRNDRHPESRWQPSPRASDAAASNVRTDRTVCPALPPQTDLTVIHDRNRVRRQLGIRVGVSVFMGPQIFPAESNLEMESIEITYVSIKSDPVSLD